MNKEEGMAKVTKPTETQAEAQGAPLDLFSLGTYCSIKGYNQYVVIRLRSVLGEDANTDKPLDKWDETYSAEMNRITN